MHPARRTVILIAVIAGIAALLLPPAMFVPVLQKYYDSFAFSILAAAGFVLVAAFLDFLTIPGKRSMSAVRKTDRVYSVGFRHRVQLEIEFRSRIRSRANVIIHDDLGPSLEQEGFPLTTQLQRGYNDFVYRLKAVRRGSYELKIVYVTVYSFLKLTKRIYRLNCYTHLQVYPDLKALSKFMLLARKSHLGLLGIRQMKRIRGDQEFDRLRDYTRDDEYRRIDWKATARNDKLIVRDYTINRNQTVVFMVDCGRIMTSEYGGVSLFDHALNASLLLSKVAATQSDRTGLLAFSDRVLRYVRPAVHSTNRMIQSSFDLEPSYAESNFEGAFRYLDRVIGQRSLLILITSVIDDRTASLVEAYLGAVSRKHLPFAVLLKHRELYEKLDAEDDPYTATAVADFLLAQQAWIQRLKNMGVLVLEAFPDEVDAQLINNYLKIKARNLL